jgi:AraC-like DNA-binding protein
MEFVKLKKHPWPEFMTSSYRSFYKGERHIARICEHYVLLFMLDGSLLFTEDGTDLELKKGEWYIQKPNLLQQGRKGSPAPFYFYIHFYADAENSENEMYPVPKELENNNTIYLQRRGCFDIPLLKPLLDQLDYCCKHRTYDVLTLQSLFLSILNKITAALPKEQEDSLALHILQYISLNYKKNINCNLLSDHFHFSTEYINRKIKQYSGYTPVQYLQQIRIARAKELLSNTDHTLSYITEEVGYHDPTVFYKAFKKLTGVAPGYWRESSRGLI